MKNRRWAIAVLGSAVLAVAFMTTGPTPAASAADAAGDGVKTFKAKCTSCHGKDGAGNTPAGKAMKIPNLASAEVQKKLENQLYAIIAKGKGKMPAYEKTLGADKCKELVAYVRTLKK